MRQRTLKLKRTRNQALRAWFYNSRYGGWVRTDKISRWIFGKQNWWWGMTPTLRQSAKVCSKIWCFCPETASIPSEVKNDHAHVITQDICNKFSEINFCVGCMVSQPNCLFQDSTTISLINQITCTQVDCGNCVLWDFLMTDLIPNIGGGLQKFKN